jgi:hypothetical protein
MFPFLPTACKRGNSMQLMLNILAIQGKPGAPKFIMILMCCIWIAIAEKQNGIHEAVGSIPSSSTKKIKKKSRLDNP